MATNPRDNQPYDHVNEVEEAMGGQIDDVNNLKTALGSPLLDPRAKKSIMEGIAKRRKNIDDAKKALARGTAKTTHDKKGEMLGGFKKSGSSSKKK